MIAFVILHYQALDETIACVKSITDNVIGDKRLLVVDNASPNGSGKQLAEYYGSSQQVQVLLLPENVGFARGNNAGYQRALDVWSPDFIVVMNNDMEIRQRDFIRNIEISYETDPFFVLGPDIYSTKGHYHQNPQRRKLPTRSELVSLNRRWRIKRFLKPLVWVKWRMHRGKRAPVRPPDENGWVQHKVVNQMLHGSCYVFSPDYLRSHPRQCFYDKTFMYLEAEILYYLELRRGEKMIYDPSIKVDHHEDVSTDATYSNQFAKSMFSIDCLIQSSEAFIDLIDSGEGQ